MAFKGYNPKDYAILFPKGLFEFEQKPIETWFDSHRLFALNSEKQKPGEKTLAPGLKVKYGHINQGSGFSNFMIFEIDPKIRKIDIEFFNHNMYYPLQAFEKLKSPKLLTNGGYFYLTDYEDRDPVAPPKVRTGNLVINKGKLINLPILDRSAIIVKKDGTVDLAFLKALGKVSFNGKIYKWAGSKTKYAKKSDMVIYNSSNIEIPVINDPVMGPSRIAQKTFIKPNKGYCLAICIRKSSYFLIDDVLTRETMINDKDMIVNMPKSISVKKGDKLKFLTVDSTDIGGIYSGVSAGPKMYKSSKNTKKQVEKEFSISDMANPNNPHDENKKLARGCLIKLKNEKFASVLVDGIPQAGDIYPGVTMSEFVRFISKLYPDFESAIATDPSSSVKVIYNDPGETKVFGNMHYLTYKKDLKGNTVFWPNGKLGRKLNSALVVY